MHLLAQIKRRETRSRQLALLCRPPSQRVRLASCLNPWLRAGQKTGQIDGEGRTQ